MRTSRSLRLGSIAIVVGLVAAACHSGGTTHPNASGSPHAGGVYRTAVEDFGFTGAFDPTGEYVQTGWAILNQLLLRNLVNYRHINGGAGNVLYPDLATSMPDVSKDGLTFTFHLQPNVKFGPPIDRAITSKDVLYAMLCLAARVPDGNALYKAFRPNPGGPVVLPAAPSVR